MNRVMKFFQRWFWHKAGRISDMPVPLDVGAMASRLDVERRARAAAANNEPSPEATELDANEAYVLHHFQDQVKKTTAWFDQARAPVEQALWRCRHILDERRFAEPVEAFERGSTALQASAERPLVAANRCERRAFRTLLAFCDANGLRREPAEHNPLLHVGILLALVLCEAAGNAWLLAKGAQGGWIEGLAMALLVAGLNVAAAFAAGLLIREVLHVAPVRKLLGSVTIVLYTAFLSTFLVLVGNLRHALLDRVANPEQAAVQWLIHGHMPPWDVWTVLFVAVSTVFALVAMWSGVHAAGDPYPGYSRVVRAHRLATAARDVLQDDCAAQAWQLYQEQDAALEQRRAAIHQARADYRDGVAELQRLAERFAGGVSELTASFVYVMRLYRRINQNIRSLPPPTSWASAPELPGFATAGRSEGAARTLAEAEQFAQGLAARIRELEDKADAAKTALGQAYDAFAANLRTFFSLTEAAAERVLPQDGVVAPAAATTEPLPTPAAPRGNGHDRSPPATFEYRV